jgi:UDPglucose 6-dehydrogenase
MTAAAPLLPGVKMCSDAYAALEDADAAVLITEWNEFRALDLARVAAALKLQTFIDFRNVYAAAGKNLVGLHYRSIGRASGAPPTDETDRRSATNPAR